MNLVDYALCSLDDFKSFMGFNDEKNDEWAKLAINMATDFIQNYCGRKFKIANYVEEYDGTGRRELQLNQFPVTAFSKLEINRATDNSDSWEDVDASRYWVDLSTGIITMTSNFIDFADDEDYVGMTNPMDNNGIPMSAVFGQGKNKYRATYSAGLFTSTDVPYDLQYACMQFANELYTDKQSGGLTEELLGDHRVFFGKAFDKVPMMQQVLDKYRDINI